MSILVPELRLLFHEEQARTRAILDEQGRRQEQQKPVIPEARANAKDERRELSKRRPGGAARMVAVLVTILSALVGAGGGLAQPMDGADRTIDFLLAAQAALADGTTAAGADIFANAQDECRTAFELELQQRADGIVEADAGAGTITPPPHPPAFSVVQFAPLPRREPAYLQLERISRCLRALSWGFGALQLRLEVQLREIRRDLTELKRER